MQTWSAGIPLKVLPVALNYSSYYRYGKNLILSVGEAIESTDIPWQESEGKRHQAFNEQLERALREGVIELDKKDVERRRKIFHRPVSSFVRLITLLPAVFGWLLHAPLYFPIRALVAITSKYNDHFDSIMVGLLLLLAPLYWLGWIYWGYLCWGGWGMSAGLLLPITVRALLYWLPQTD